MVWTQSGSSTTVIFSTGGIVGQNVGPVCPIRGVTGATGSLGSTIFLRQTVLSATFTVGHPPDPFGTTITFTGNGTNHTLSQAAGIYMVVPETWGSHRYEVRSERQLLEARRDIARRGAAEAKAEALLRSCLSEKQESDLTEFGHFDVNVGAGRTYRIKRGIAGNVYLLGADGRETDRFCAHPSGVPPADAMLAQKLTLESDEDRFLRIANRTPVMWR